MRKEITVIVNRLSSEVDNFNYAIFEDKHDQLISFAAVSRPNANSVLEQADSVFNSIIGLCLYY